MYSLHSFLSYLFMLVNLYFFIYLSRVFLFLKVLHNSSIFLWLFWKWLKNGVGCAWNYHLLMGYSIKCSALTKQVSYLGLTPSMGTLLYILVNIWYAAIYPCTSMIWFDLDYYVHLVKELASIYKIESIMFLKFWAIMFLKYWGTL